MKIKRIQVKNIGPYVNENAFDFDVSDITKRMVLIGGKNGAGKTTLFNAIKICLYGCVAYGFESNNAKYFAEIEKIINANEKLQKIGEAEVVIDLLMDDGKYDHTYTFVRSWRVAGKKIAETFTVYKDGETLSETEKSDFESYLLQTLPPNLFRFYFFDGEKISDFVFNSSKNSDFKDAFLKLCSLDTMEIIRENFCRISRSKAKGAMTLSAEYDRCLEADNLITQLALVNKTAVNKLEEFESLISQRPELLQKCIIFVQTMEYGAKLQEILVRYSDKYHTYYADDEKINLENFAAGKIDCLLTCKKVSEGIDISSVTNIILFSSDRSRLVTTQRIGRALRLDKNNPEKKATVVDFVIEDSEENDNNADADRAEWLTELSQTRRCEHEK